MYFSQSVLIKMVVDKMTKTLNGKSTSQKDNVYFECSDYCTILISVHCFLRIRVYSHKNVYSVMIPNSFAFYMQQVFLKKITVIFW